MVVIGRSGSEFAAHRRNLPGSLDDEWQPFVKQYSKDRSMHDEGCIFYKPDCHRDRQAFLPLKVISQGSADFIFPGNQFV
jgi:hypothetical protein